MHKDILKTFISVFVMATKKLLRVVWKTEWVTRNWGDLQPFGLHLVPHISLPRPPLNCHRMVLTGSAPQMLIEHGWHQKCVCLKHCAILIYIYIMFICLFISVLIYQYMYIYIYIENISMICVYIYIYMHDYVYMYVVVCVSVSVCIMNIISSWDIRFDFEPWAF